MELSEELDELSEELGELSEELDELPDELELSLEEDDSPDLLPLAFEPYPSAYQPPPLRMKVLAEIKRVTLERQSWQRVRGSSVIRCTTSN